MSIVVTDPDRTGPHTGSAIAREPVLIYARALGGPAHRTRVPLDGHTPPQFLDIAVPGSDPTVARYRLLRAPRTRRAITDDSGDYVYVSARQHPTPHSPR